MSEDNFKELCISRFSELFSKAKNINETQFLTSFFAFTEFKGHTILSYITDYEFNEVLEILAMFAGLQSAKEIDNKTKVRLMMLLHCHITEVDFIYMVLHNMIMTIQGNKYSPKMTIVTKKGDTKELEYPFDKIELLIKDSDEIGIPLKKVFSEFYSNHLRNAFSHSQYWLNGDGNMKISKYLSPTSSKFFKKETGQPSYSYQEIENIFNKSIVYVKSFVDVYTESNLPYADGNSYPTIFGKILFSKKHGWVFENQ